MADSPGYMLPDSTTFLRPDSSNEQYLLGRIPIRLKCKAYSFLNLYKLEPVRVHREIADRVKDLVVQKTPLLKVKGNVLYDVNYRSRIDTPYAERDIFQHTAQIYLDMVYKERYPFRVYLTNRFSNLSLFRKYTDLNFQFNPADFSRMTKTRIMNAIESYVLSKAHYLDSLRKEIELTKAELALIRGQIEVPDMAQILVEERERDLFGGNKEKQEMQNAPDLAGFDLDVSKARTFKFSERIRTKGDEGGRIEEQLGKKNNSLADSIKLKTKWVDRIIAKLVELEMLYKKAKSMQQFNLNEGRREIEDIKDVKVLEQKMRQFHLPDSILPKGYKTLYALRSLGIGRSVVNYSELSVKNVSITGLQVEYNPHYYYAVSAGKVDYRFRDYIIPAHERSHQYVVLARFGKGMKNGNHLFFSGYTGRRQLFNSSVSFQSGNRIPEFNLAGFTIEGYYQLNRNTALVAEVAKSTIPYYSLDSFQKQRWLHSVTRVNDRTNEAYSLKLNALVPLTKTRFTGTFKYLGANFQSFSTFTTGASQINWLTKVEQPFFSRKLNVIASLQQHDYSNPFIATTYKGTSVLASLQATLRIKKWPVMSVGYYPSYQLTKLSDNNYSESRYYSLVANAGYYYKIKDVQMSAFAVYTQFYNQAADSGFVYFNSKNVMLSQAAIMKKYSVLLNVSVSTNTDYSLYTIENSHQFVINKYISIGGGIKYNRQTVFNREQWGYSGNFLLKIPMLGEIQLTADKGFLPGPNRTLVENKTGRLTYFKTF